MGKIEFFSIFLERLNTIYYTGETLVGTVKIRAKERFKINSVFITLKGSAFTRWTEGTNKNRTVYSSTVTYLNFDLTLMGKQPGQQELYMEYGDYTFPFQIVLPPNLPSSFEHTHGRIRYSLNACVDIPWHIDSHTERSFTVLSHTDLNMYPNLRQPYGASDEKILCCGPCKSAPIIGNFSVLKTGYVPGEHVFFNATLDNQSNKEIKEMTVTIYQRITLIGSSLFTTKTIYHKRNISNIKYHRKVPPRTLEKWENGFLIIPPVVASSNGTCSIINVTYEVVFNFDATGVAISKDIAVPITIGTIPFINYNNQPNPIIQGQSNIPPNLPPSYQACMFDNGSNEMPHNFEQKGEIFQTDSTSFKPFYPYYNNLSNSNQTDSYHTTANVDNANVDGVTIGFK